MPIETASVDATAAAAAGNVDDEESSGLFAYLAMPLGEERRKHKATMPPPLPQEFPIEEEPARVLASDAPSWRPPPSGNDDGPLAILRGKAFGSPKNLAIAGGAVVLVMALLVFALGGRADKKQSAARPEEPSRPTEEKLPVIDPPSGSDREAVVPDSASGSADTSADDEIEIALPDNEGSAAGSGPEGADAATPSTDAGSGSATTATTTVAPKVSKTRQLINALLKNKEIVLEYDGRVGQNSAPESDQAAIAKARASHAAGTQRLNAGDYDGALGNYRKSLHHYPGYVGSYRGMGLAYERKGDKDNALKALRMYVSVAPHATDVAAMRKRIDTLAKR